MATTSANERLAQQINHQARQDPNSAYAGKLVGIAHGRVIVVADTWPEVVARLRQVEPDPEQCFCLDASADYERIDEIWNVAGCQKKIGTIRYSAIATSDRCACIMGRCGGQETATSARMPS